MIYIIFVLHCTLDGYTPLRCHATTQSQVSGVKGIYKELPCNFVLSKLNDFTESHFYAHTKYGVFVFMYAISVRPSSLASSILKMWPKKNSLRLTTAVSRSKSGFIAVSLRCSPVIEERRRLLKP